MRRKPNGYWTKEKCHEEALKYKTRIDFQKNSGGSYGAALKKDWLDDICSHMDDIKKPNGYWTKEKCHEESLKFNDRTNFNLNSFSAYRYAMKNNWLDDICSHMTEGNKGIQYWTKEKCHEEALKYETRGEFSINSKSAYGYSCKNNWLDDICSHMVEINKPKNYWTKEKCYEEALKHKTRSEFSIKGGSAYYKAYVNNWLDDICSHMVTGLENTSDRCIYAYEFSNNHAYIGLTHNLKQRKNCRDHNENDIVTRYSKSSKLVPILKIIHEYNDYKLASQLEIETIDKYRKEGWYILNRVKGGGLGGNAIGPRKWTKEAIKESAKKFQSKTLWSRKEGSSHILARNHGKEFYEECCKHMVSRNWTPEECLNEAKKYKTRKEWIINSGGSYNASKKFQNLFEKCCLHMVDGRLGENRHNIFKK